jgi:hypothetical protein
MSVEGIEEEERSGWKRKRLNGGRGRGLYRQGRVVCYQ